MNNEIEFIHLNEISDIDKFPGGKNLDSSFRWNPKEVIYVPRIITKDYIISRFIEPSDISGYIIFNINNRFLLGYITLLLNSGALRYKHLNAPNPSVSLHITLSSLKKFFIPKIDLLLQSKLTHIDNQFLIYKTSQSSERDRYYEVKASFFRMLCDSMVFQLYHSSLFEENNIDLIGNIDILFPNNLFLDFEQMFNILSSESNALIDNAKAFTHCFINIAEKHKI